MWPILVNQGGTIAADDIEDMGKIWYACSFGHALRSVNEFNWMDLGDLHCLNKSHA